MPELDLGGAGALLMAVVRSLGLGELPVALVVTSEGCQQINQASGQTVCQIERDAASALVCPVLLRSRIGSPYFLGLSPFDDQGAWPARTLPTRTTAIALPKAEVLSWSQIVPKPAQKQSSASATAHANRSTAQPAVVTRWSVQAHDDWLRQQCSLAE